MDLGFNDEQRLLLEALGRLVDAHQVLPATPAACLESASLEQALVDGGYLHASEDDLLGPVAGWLTVEAVSRTPFAVEVAATALAAPMAIGMRLPRPLAVLDLAEPGPIRFLHPGGALLVISDAEVRLVERVDAVTAVPSQFAYPYALISGGAVDDARPLEDVSPAALRLWLAIGRCAEAVGAMQAALTLTVRYVSDRRQFGRPIGSFQAVQHRLAECACLIDGARMISLKAAATGDPLDAALAETFVHDAITQLVNETNQLHGAIGLSMEYPLHYWSYRMRALQGESGRGARRDRSDRP